MGLLDAAQAASNAAASTVSGPVDMLAWLLRKAGVNVGEPVGGSYWMKRKGLTKDVSPGASQVVGETLGLLAPTVAAAKAPQIAKGLLAAADNLAAPRTLNPQQGAIVWHGSPHKFDKFDSSKIGTGEGAQAYGHGLYLAESPKVADAYKTTLSGLDQLTPAGRAARYMDRANGDVQQAMRLAWNDYNSAANNPAFMNAAYSAVEALKSGKVPSPSLYKVDLPDNAIARMLDWDKPLSQQASDVRDLLNRVGRQPGPLGLDRVVDDMRGSDWGKLVNTPEGTAALRRAGIPGIRYLDGGSRGAGSGTSNFVVFPGEEGLLTILERNGVPLR